MEKPPNQKAIWPAVVSILFNIGVIITLYLMGSLIHNAKYYFLFTENPPTGTLKFFMVTLSIAALILHYKRPNWVTWAMIPILFIFFIFLSSAMSNNAYIFEAKPEEWGIEALILKEKFSSMKGIQYYPLVACISYLLMCLYKSSSNEGINQSQESHTSSND